MTEFETPESSKTEKPSVAGDSAINAEDDLLPMNASKGSSKSENEMELTKTSVALKLNWG
jgi:hypothetical protein